MNPQKANKILNELKKHYPNAKTILQFSNNFELLVSVMLSAQTTDLQVNKVTATLFPKYKKEIKEFEKYYREYKDSPLPKVELVEIINFAKVQVEDLARDISSIGLYKGKAKNVNATSQILLDKYLGVIPKTMEELTSLPGVGRKTANVVLGNAYKIYVGIAVDTHVKRLAQKYGLTKSSNPEIIEKDLMKLFDKKDWFKVTYLLIEHGRAIRTAKKDFIDELS